MSNQKNNWKKKFWSIIFVVLLAFGVVTTVFPAISTTHAATDVWTLVYNARTEKAYPALQETVWQKNASMPPNSQYDLIGLHRLVKAGTAPTGVMIILPGLQSSGEEVISNPPSDNLTLYENYSQAIYWANRGFDVYAIDYRNHFVPNTLNSSQLSFMLGWGWDQYVSDVKEAVNKVKEVSGVQKIFLAGMSQGGEAAMNFAAKYWKDDLRGIILLDANLQAKGNNVAVKRGNETNTYNLTTTLATYNSSNTFSIESNTLRAKYALENPTAPAQYPLGTPLTPTINPLTNKTWANITEWFTYTTHFSTYGAGAISNINGGFGSITSYLQFIAAGDRYIPRRVYADAAAYVDWINCPYLTYDYDDHYREIGVPILAFSSALWTNGTGTFRFINGVNNTDFTGIMLPNYGQYDCWIGTYSARDVSQPALDWMINHTLNASVTPQALWLQTGYSVTLSVSVSGGPAPYTYQWYEGSTALAGQNLSQLRVSKNAPGTYMYFCTVTDSMQTATNAASATLVYSAPSTPISTPTAIATPIISPTPLPTQQASPTQPESPAATSTPSTQPPPTNTPNELTLSQIETYSIAAVVIIVILIAAVALAFRKMQNNTKKTPKKVKTELLSFFSSRSTIHLSG